MLRTAYEPILIGLMLLLFLSGCQHKPGPAAPDLELTSAELRWLGEQVFRNECAAREACLVHWNEGEAFPSLGIGHFIWYPTDVDGPFVESFPAMIDHLIEHGAVPPAWVTDLNPFDAPWPDRETFLQRSDTDQVKRLRNFLAATKDRQADFLAQRAIKGLVRVVDAAPESEQPLLSDRIAALVSTPGGVYAVIDYVNFKGEGLAVSERYNCQGWGLLQVLQAMEEGEGVTALQAFREAAAVVLTRRAENADRPIEKQRWLPGWLNRLETYREPE